MNGTTHKIAGLCSGLIVSKIANNPIVGIGITTSFAVIGSLVPDIDEPNSTIGQKAKISSHVIKHTMGHRGIVHTPLMLCIGALILFFVKWKYGILIDEKFNYPITTFALQGFLVGYASHLLLDMLTPQGIKFFYPFSKRSIHVIGLRSSFREFFTIAFVIIATILFYMIK